ncbi:MAG: redoxin domain-containing protein [Planctomycetes bacterium]|nr:redoxin domain-containing protein [Planctomycetota bacterium]
MDAISTPFRAEWRDRIQKAGASYAYRADAGEVRFAALLLEKGLAENPGGLVDRMITLYSKSEALEPLAENFRWAMRSLETDRFVALMATVIDDTPNDTIRAQAHYSRALALSRSEVEADRSQVERDYARVVELMPEDSILSLRARGPKFEQSRLQIGMSVPDITAPDIDGKEFKLSDYRGKVVMLDFWGFW